MLREQEEEDIIKRVFKLDDQKVESIMTPRNEIIWIDLEDDREINKVKIIESKRSIFPISSGELDDFIGVVQAKDILSAMFSEDEFDVHKIVKEPLVVSEHLETLELLTHAGASPPRLSAARRESGSRCPWLGEAAPQPMVSID